MKDSPLLHRLFHLQAMVCPLSLHDLFQIQVLQLERLQLLCVLSDQRLVVLDSTVLASTRVGLLQLLLPPAPLLIVLVLYVCVLPDPLLQPFVCT